MVKFETKEPCTRKWLQIILMLAVVVRMSCGQELRIEIDTLDEFATVGENVDGKCTAVETLTEFVDCIDGAPNTDTTGFWSSCVESNCELKIRIGNIDEDQVPSRIELHSFVGGINSQIRVRYKINPTDGYRNLQDIENTVDWVTTLVALDPDLGFNSNSEIYLRLASGFATSDMDVFDKITFVYTETPVPTPTTAAPTTTPQSPGLPDETLDSGSTLPPGWSTNCEYRLNHEDYSPSRCPMKVRVESDARVGFWSSCGRYCALTYSPSVAQRPPPTSVIVNSYVSGHGSLDVWVSVQGVLKHVGTIKDTTWTNATFPLAHFGLDSDSEILFEPSSTRYPNHVDLLDYVTIRWQ